MIAITRVWDSIKIKQKGLHEPEKLSLKLMAQMKVELDKVFDI